MEHDGERAEQTRPVRALRGWIVALALGISAWLGFTALVEGVAAPRAEGRVDPQGRAAVVIRDPVHPVETLGTWLFVLPRLERSYTEVRTFTQHERGEGLFGTYSHDEREPFLAALRELDGRYERVDVFLLGHTNNYVRWIEGLERETFEHIGLVYNSGCYCGRQAGLWTDIGVAAYVGHPSAAAHAPFFVHFFRAWTRGARLDEAVAEANDRADGFYRRLAFLSRSEETAERWRASRAAITGDPELSLGPGREEP